MGKGAGVPMGAIVGCAPGVGNPASEFVWPFNKASEVMKTPPARNSILIVGM